MPKVDLPVLALSILALFSTVGFGVYYYQDRYRHSDQAVVEYKMQNIEAQVKENPQNPDLRVVVANYYLESGLIDQAIQQSQQALLIDSKHQGALILLANAYRKTGAVDNAIAKFNQVLDLNKDNPIAKIDPRLEMVNYELGTLYSRQGRYAEAVSAFKRALEISATDADAHFGLGVAYQNQNDCANAILEFKQAIRFIPDFVEAYSGLATCQTALGDSAQAQYANAMVLLLKGNAANAAVQLEELVAQSPGMKQAYFGLGLADEKLGKRDEAIKALREYIKSNPNDIAAQQALGRISKGNGQ